MQWLVGKLYPDALCDTKAVVVLAALTRVQATAEISVPSNLSREEVDELLQFLYEETPGEDFVDEDADFWEEGTHTFEYLYISNEGIRNGSQ